MRTKPVAYLILFGLFVLILGWLALSAPKRKSSQAVARQGVLDLRKWDMRHDGALRVRGTWSFYWRKLISPAEVDGAKPTGYIKLPSIWNGKTIGGVKLSSQGYATYRLQLRLSKPQVLTLRINRVYTCYRFYINGVLRASRGKVSTTPSQDDFEVNPSLVTFLAGKQVDLVLQVSNYAHRKGGPADAIQLGGTRQLMRDRSLRIAYDLFSFSFLFIIGLYYLTLHFMMRRTIATFYFAMVCFLSAVRVILINEQFLLHLLPVLSYPLLLRLEYVTLYMLCVFLIMFMNATFPRESSSWALRISQVYWGTLALVAIVAPPSLYTFSWWFFFISMPFLVGYVVVVNVLAIRNKSEGAKILVVGIVVVTCLGAQDTFLYSTGREITLELFSIGFLTLIFCQALLLAKRFSKAFEMAEQLSLELEEKNTILTHLNEASSRFVPFEFLALLGKDNLTEVSLGDQIQKKMSILFSDIRSFTTISEGMTPEENFMFINDYLKHMEPVVHNYEGFIDKYIGDAVMALFDKSVDDSVKAAIGMVRALNTFNQEQLREGRVPIKIGVGLNTGMLMLGTIGGEQRMDGTVISDAVNLAARIEGMTKHYGASILISEFTYLELQDPGAYQIRVIDKVQVKGKLEPVTVYEVYDGEPDEIRTQKAETQEQFVEAFDAYTEGHFALALKQFSAIQIGFPEDKATTLYVERCALLHATPPSDWKGVMQLTSK